MEYAFLLAINPTIITEGDTIELHSLGVLWNSCARKNLIDAVKPLHFRGLF
jgi:hypothetical protein